MNNNNISIGRFHSVLHCLFFSILLYSCKEKEIVTQESITVSLMSKFEKSPVGRTLNSFRFLDSIPNNFKGIPESDNVLLGYIKTTSKGVPENYNVKFAGGESIDSIYCLSGYRNKEQFYVLDINCNKDFSDDELITFPLGLDYGEFTRSEENPLDSFPSRKLIVKKNQGKDFFIDTINISVFPYKSYFTYNRPPKNQLTRLKRKLLIAARFNDYLFGSFYLKDSLFKVAVDKYGVPCSNFILGTKKKINTEEEYCEGDTLIINGLYHKISKVSLKNKSLTISSLKLRKNEKVFGFKKGFNIKDYKILSLEKDTFNLKGLFNSKQLLLLDFWGTWCGPCKKLTPDLVELKNKYENKLSLISLAYEEDPEQVDAYIKANNMNWFSGIIKGKPKTANPTAKIIKELRIDCFPTFILINQNLEIVYRVCGGGDSFEKMVRFIDAY